ncbi:ABC transporter permease [Leucobacter musarum]|uniref:ABC transporter permease n=1 Tax=Leucobacter musarum TaxID=1930747 RepID=UPI0006A7C12A|nr:ABC transporter permease [Leucobacter musarum]
MATTTVAEQTNLAEEHRNSSWLVRTSQIQGFQVLIFLTALIILFTVLAPASFGTASNAWAILMNTAILAVLGIGMTFVIITAGIDLSIGSVLVFSSVVSSKVMSAVGGNGWSTALIGIAVALLAGAAWGLINGLIITRLNVPPLIATLGTMGVALGLSQVITNGVDIRAVPASLSEAVGYGKIFGQVPVLVVISAVLVVIGIILLHQTKFGLHTFAVGSNPEGSRRVGIKVDRHIVLVYMLSGLTAGIAGVLSLAYFQTTTLSGQTVTNLNVIAGVVIGGTSLFGGIGAIFGTVIGLFIPAVLQNGFVVIGVQAFWQQVVVGIVLVIAVAIDQRKRSGKGGLLKLFARRSSGR